MNKISNILEKNLTKFISHEYIFEKKEGKYISYSYETFYNDSKKIAGYLIDKNLLGKKIGIFSPNSYNYMICDIGIMAYVGIAVELSANLSSLDLKNIIDKVELDAIIYDTLKTNEIEELKNLGVKLKFISFDEINNSNIKNEVKPLEKVDSLCSKIVFSSGTTGIPKAVMLSQNNMFANLENLLKRAPMKSDDKCYLFLPLSHTYGGIGNFLYSVYTGMKIYLCSDKNLILQEIQEVSPTVISMVPMLIENIYNYSKFNNVELKDILGGNSKFVFCGGAYLDSSIREYFKNSKINLMEAYGLSETSSLISFEYPNFDDFTSVGTIFENQDVKILNPSENGIGEIAVRGDNIFIGYYNDEEKYNNSFENGYFKTGDLGYIKGNKLYLVGRKKREFIGSNGRNIDLEELEKLIINELKINKVKLYEENRNLNCIVFLPSEVDEKEIEMVIKNTIPRYCSINKIKFVIDNLDNRIK